MLAAGTEDTILRLAALDTLDKDSVRLAALMRMTTMSKGLWVSVATLFVMGMLGVLTWHLTGPRYDGRTAAEWFDEALRTAHSEMPLGDPDQESASFQRCVEAFRGMGARGARFLAEEYLLETPIVLEWYDKAASKLSGLINLPARQPSWRQRESTLAAGLLLRLGHSSAPALLRATHSRTARVRALAASLLGQLGPGNPVAQERLLELLSDPSVEVVYGALEVLWMTSPDPETAIPMWVPLLSHAHWLVRVESSFALGCLQPDPDLTLGPLLALLSDSYPTARANAAKAIGLAGRRSEDILARLEAQLSDSSEVARFRAAEALARLCGPETAHREAPALQVLAQAEASGGNYFRLMGFNGRTALGAAEVSTTPMIGLFRELLSNPLAYVRRDAIEGLRFYFEAHESAAHPDIIALLNASQKDRNGMIRHMAGSLLKQLGSRARKDPMFSAEP